MKRWFISLLCMGMICGINAAENKEHIVEMNAVTAEGISNKIGTITIKETPYGLLFTPSIDTFPEGIHGFHIHEKGTCEPIIKGNIPIAAGAAGGHFDPKQTGKHLGPYNPHGHLGDLPALYANQIGHITTPVLAPRIKKLSVIAGRSLMIHAGGDNLSDHPHVLGGGGARLACGVIDIN